MCYVYAIFIEVKQGLESPAVRKKIDDDENKARRLNDSNNSDLTMNNGSSSSSSLEADNAEFVSNHSKQTHKLIEQQDKGLEGLAVAVDR